MQPHQAVQHLSLIHICVTLQALTDAYATGFTVTLFGKGGGSGETGSVSIGQGLKRDASGAIAVRIGEGLDFDSANALTVRKETVMTSEDPLDEAETQQEIVDMLK